jgi:hypothetical protein
MLVIWAAKRSVRLNNIALNPKISPVQKKIGWETVASVLLKEVNPRGPLPCIFFQRSRIRDGVVRLGECRAFKDTSAMAWYHRNEGLQQSVQGQRAEHPQLIVSVLALFFGAGI